MALHRIDRRNPIYNTIEKVEAYWNNLKPGTTSSQINYDKWVTQAPLFEQLSHQISAAITLWDVVENRFIYATDKRKIAWDDPSLITTEDGVDESIFRVHPDYLNSGLLMQQKGFEYLLANSSIPRNEIIISFDGCYKRSDGNYIHFIQQAVAVEADNKGHPLLILSYIFDISHLKKEKTSNLVITAPHEVLLWNYNFQKKILEPTKPLSAQEKTILSLLAQGKTSKEIADALHISSHTADTHRRNLLKKTNCLDTTALVSYGKLVGLI
jgi:DNA-binding CsgD family transcriptional regulator